MPPDDDPFQHAARTQRDLRKRTNSAELRVLAAALVAAIWVCIAGCRKRPSRLGRLRWRRWQHPQWARTNSISPTPAWCCVPVTWASPPAHHPRFIRFDVDLTFDPRDLPASKVVTTIDASSFEMDAAPQMCLDIMKGPQMLDTTKFPQIVFKSEGIRMTGAKSMEISGTLTLHGVTRPTVLVATYNGGYAGMPNMDPQARVGFSAHGSFKRSDFGIRLWRACSGYDGWAFVT